MKYKTAKNAMQIVQTINNLYGFDFIFQNNVIKFC